MVGKEEWPGSFSAGDTKLSLDDMAAASFLSEDEEVAAAAARGYLRGRPRPRRVVVCAVTSCDDELWLGPPRLVADRSGAPEKGYKHQS